MRRRPSSRLLGVGLLFSLGSPTAGCDFFQELKSEPGAIDTDTDTGADTAETGDTETDDGLCELQNDDRCLDQDTVASCGLEDGVVSEVDCVATCGTFVNFTCVGTASGQHACWCAEPGPTKVFTCAELEECIAGCDLSQSLDCADQCFSRTDALTIRIYGALVHCAESTCEDACQQTPDACQACLDAARLGGGGGCSLPRAVCDDDRSPDDPWGGG